MHARTKRARHARKKPQKTPSAPAPRPLAPAADVDLALDAERHLEAAVYKAEQRGGSLVQVQASALPSWSCHVSHRFSQPFEAVAGGVWCELCTESLGERAARVHVERRGWDYRCEAKFPSLVAKEQLRFDLYVPSVRWLVEIDGEQHFGGASFGGRLVDRLKNDEIKDEWCVRERFNLLRIPFWELANVERLLDEFHARLAAGEGPLYACEYRGWRQRAIAKLEQGKRAPKAPIPADAKERAQDARRERREEEADVLLQHARGAAPPELTIRLED